MADDGPGNELAIGFDSDEPPVSADANADARAVSALSSTTERTHGSAASDGAEQGLSPRPDWLRQVVKFYIGHGL